MYAIDRAKTCPYSNDGLTWPIIEASNHLRIEVVRSAENQTEWNVIRSIMQQLVEKFSTDMQEDENRIVISIKRPDSITSEVWAELLQKLINYCREIPNKTKIYPDTIVITDLSRTE
jgi:hypothetical protein